MRAQTGKAILLLFVATVSTITILNGGVGRTFHSGTRELLTLVHPVEQTSPGIHHPASTVVKADVGDSEQRNLREQDAQLPTERSAPAADTISTVSAGSIRLASTVSSGRRGSQQATQAKGKGGGNGKNSAAGKSGGRQPIHKRGEVITGGLPPRPKNSKELTYGIPLGSTLKKVDEKINSSFLGRLIKRTAQPMPLMAKTAGTAGTSSKAATSSPKPAFRRKLEKHREQGRKMAEGVAVAGEEVGLQAVSSSRSSSTSQDQHDSGRRSMRSRKNKAEASGSSSAASTAAATQSSDKSASSTSGSKNKSKKKKSKDSQMVFGIPLGTGKDAVAYHMDRTIIGKEMMNRRRRSANKTSSKSAASSSGNSDSGTPVQVGSPVSPITFKRPAANSKVWQTTGTKPAPKPAKNRRRLREASGGAEGKEGVSAPAIRGGNYIISGAMEGRVHRVLGDVTAGEVITEAGSSSGAPSGMGAEVTISGGEEVRVERHLGEQRQQ